MIYQAGRTLDDYLESKYQGYILVMDFVTLAMDYTS